MTVSLTLPPDLEARIQSEAARRSVDVEQYLVWLVSSSLPADSDADIRKRALAAIDSLSLMGTETEQRDTFDYLSRAIDEDRLSDRKLFK
jgi:hypothetical protein